MSKSFATIDIRGDAQMLARLRRIVKEQPKRAKGALYRLGEAIMTDSKNNYVPARDSILKNSGYVDKPKVSDDTISVKLAYGGPASDYAIAVHEHLSEHSPPSWRGAEAAGRPVQFNPSGRGPKFLETPLLEAANTAADELAKDLKL